MKKDERDRILESSEEERNRIRALLGSQEIRAIAGESLFGFVGSQSVFCRMPLLQHLGSRDAPEGQRRLMHPLLLSWYGTWRPECINVRKPVLLEDSDPRSKADKAARDQHEAHGRRYRSPHPPASARPDQFLRLRTPRIVSDNSACAAARHAVWRLARITGRSATAT
jgi:hypothetical protein